ncbi:hypothetical protein L6R29_21270 [Myxococcota bacterium]|nr:hypothetical protein [Myxococcota bacterium]
MQQRYRVDRLKRSAFWSSIAWLGACCLGLFLGCRPDQDLPPSADHPDVLAVVGQEVITIQALREAIKEQSASHQRFFLGLPQKKALLQELMIVRLLSMEARRLGLSEDQEVRFVQRRAAIELLAQQLRHTWQAQSAPKTPQAQSASAQAIPEYAAFAKAWLAEQRKKRGVRIDQARFAALQKRLAYRPPSNPPLSPTSAPISLPMLSPHIAPSPLPSPRAASLPTSPQPPAPSLFPAPSRLPAPSLPSPAPPLRSQHEPFSSSPSPRMSSPLLPAPRPPASLPSSMPNVSRP